MTNTTFSVAMAITAGLLFSQNGSPQGTVTYVSNLGQPSSGAVSVGNDSWFAANFITGTNAAGYLLNSVQLQMADASGTPNGFSVTIYSSVGGAGIFPGSGLGGLAGAADPTTAGVYTYTPGSSLTLSANTVYFVVVTAGSTVGDGAYEWSVTGSPTTGYNSYHWGGELFFAQSVNGSSWSYTSSTYGLYSLDATPAPEPGAVGLMVVGGLVVGWRRWKARSV
jgi:hypothetical protein